MEREVHKSNKHADARDWDIRQVVEMTPVQRQEIAKRLKHRVYGTESPDVKEFYSHSNQKTLRKNRKT